MATSLETNKVLASILAAGIIASGSGVISRMLYHPEVPEETAYAVAVETTGESGEAAEGAPEGQPLGVLLAAADPAAGESVARKCTSCHSFEQGGPNKIGPVLYDVVGREIAAVEGFAYSDALAGKDGAWEYEALDAFIAAPGDWAPGTKMAFAGINDEQDRADLLMYLHSISEDPPPLPEPEEAPAEGGEQVAEGEGAEAAAAEQPEGDAAAAAEGEEDVAAVSEEAAGEPAEEQAPADSGGEGGGIAGLIAAADPAEGEKAVRACAACHSFEEGGPNKVGPALYNVVGREIAAVEGFSYSDALAGKDGAWDYAALDAFLANPKEYAPGTKMAFAGVRKEEDRAAIIAYLRSMSENPPPLPGGG